MALVLGNGFGVGKWLWCWGMAMMFANGYGVGEIGFLIFYFNFSAGLGAQVVSHQSCRTLAVLRANPFRVSAANIAFGSNVWKNWLPKGGCCQRTKFPPKIIYSKSGDLHIVT
jgi:hypothetical protein